jgi:hypothetical protein
MVVQYGAGSVLVLWCVLVAMCCWVQPSSSGGWVVWWF